MNVSELFATPNIPASALKRKAWNVAPAADELVPAKRAKPSPAPAPSSAAKGKQRAVTIEDDREDSDDDERNASGDFAPGQDADAFADEDEDGRMYGSGLSSTQKVRVAACAGGADGCVANHRHPRRGRVGGRGSTIARRRA